MNSCIFIGRLVKDPELKYSQNGTAITTFTIAVNRIGTNGEADFINIKTFNNTAKNCSEYLTKGSQVSVEGRLQINKNKKEDGTYTNYTDILAHKVEFLSKKSENQTSESKEKSYVEEYPFEIDDDSPF